MEQKHLVLIGGDDGHPAGLAADILHAVQVSAADHFILFLPACLVPISKLIILQIFSVSDLFKFYEFHGDSPCLFNS